MVSWSDVEGRRVLVVRASEAFTSKHPELLEAYVAEVSESGKYVKLEIPPNAMPEWYPSDAFIIKDTLKDYDPKD